MLDSIWSIFIAVLVFGAIIFFHELAHFLTAKLAKVKIHEFSVGMGPAIVKKEYGGTLYSLRWLPIGGYVAMEGEDEQTPHPDAITNKSWAAQVMVFIAGSVANLLMGYVILMILVGINGYVGTTIVSRFLDGATSSEYLQLEDEIIEVNGNKVATSNDVTYEFMRDTDGLIDFVVLRDGGEVVIPPIQFEMYEAAEGVSLIEMDFRVYGKDATFTDYITYPFNWGYSISKQVWFSLIDLLSGRYSVNQLTGPIGVTSAISTASQNGIDDLLLMVAIIAINVGIFNLLPLPALDGGKILIVTLEKLTKRRINQKVLEAITVGTLVLLLGLMVFVSCNDVMRLFEG